MTRKMPNKATIRKYWYPKLFRLHFTDNDNRGKFYSILGYSALSVDRRLPKGQDLYKELQHSLEKDLLLRDFCYGCGIPAKTERCHIKPKNAGGDDTVENLHLLCANCHKQSEGYSGMAYWRWFYHKDTEIHFKLWCDEAMRKYNSMSKQEQQELVSNVKL